MGGMICFYFNANYPGYFAASLFVGSQWDVDVLSPLKNQISFYIVSAADPKASVGMNEIGELLSDENSQYGEIEFSAKLPDLEKKKKVMSLLEQGLKRNFIRFTAGTVTPENSTGCVAEHMYSFDYAYQLKTVRQWLFKQEKEVIQSSHPRAGMPGRVTDINTNARKYYREALAYLKGTNQGQNFDKARDLFIEAFKLGDMKVGRYLGIIYEKGLTVKQDLKKAFNYYDEAQSNGDKTSKGLLGLMYESGQAVEKDLSIALQIYQDAAPSIEEVQSNIHPSIVSILRIASFYESGIAGLKKDKAQAIKWYKCAASSTNSDDYNEVIFAKEQIKRLK